MQLPPKLWCIFPNKLCILAVGKRCKNLLFCFLQGLILLSTNGLLLQSVYSTRIAQRR